MKLLVALSIVFLFLLTPIPNSFSELELSTNAQVYSPEHTLQVYGTGLPGENLILRLFAPDESITKFDQVQTDSDGNFNYQLLTWPSPSHGVPYGTYVVEVLSTEQNGLSKKIDITFSSTTELISVAIERQIDTVVFAPDSGWAILATIIAAILSGSGHMPLPICALPLRPQAKPISTFLSS